MFRKKKILNKNQKMILLIAAVVFAVAIGVAVLFIAFSGKEESKPADVKHENVQDSDKELPEHADEEDPQDAVEEEKQNDEGANVEASEVVDPNKKGEITYGIDVSKYQGTINWKKVAEAGIDFAMIRVGYRTAKSGEIVADTNAKYNMQEAQKYGVKVGVYFFSTAITKEEAVEEAKWVANYIAKYQITYPVAFDCEGYEKATSRQHAMTNTQRTDAAVAFLDEIAELGYSPMFYAARDDMEQNAKWEMERISSLYRVWVAQYPDIPYPQTENSDYSGPYIMWQYTNKGSVPGISGAVDMNIAYFGYAWTESPKDSDTPEEVGADVEALMNFTSVNEIVTAKEKTNLRDKPSQGEDSTVMKVLMNGDTATRTGVSSSGWSRVLYKGNVYYAVSSYLTTDLGYKAPQQEPDDGIATEFTGVNEQVTAKEAVNLRTLPSVTREDSVVVAQIVKGDIVTRTGINTELGWSRVVYNGQTLYCVSSYLMPAEELTEEPAE